MEHKSHDDLDIATIIAYTYTIANFPPSKH
jgi:hypothetical protein